VRALIRCRQLGIQTPAIFCVDRERSAIYMEYINDADTVRQLIDVLLTNDNGYCCACFIHFFISANFQTCRKQLSAAIGHILATLHKNNIVHGDLTTSNILVREDEVVHACKEPVGCGSRNSKLASFIVFVSRRLLRFPTPALGNRN
jgi:tRNA A-37 threonylcarbamoyl transferase component Bud32